MGKRQLLNELINNGITFQVDIPDLGGRRGVSIDNPIELLVYLENKEQFFANEHGVSLKEYLLWESDNYSVICSGTTAKGKRCRQVATGGSSVPAKKWVKMQGEYCVFHGGE